MKLDSEKNYYGTFTKENIEEGSAILWAHKSMAEYFASQYIVTDAKQDQERICDHIANTIELQRFKNVLDLLYDSDIAVFGRHFISALVKFYRTTLIVCGYHFHRPLLQKLSNAPASHSPRCLQYIPIYLARTYFHRR